MTYQTVITAAGDSRPLFFPSGFATPKSLVRRQGVPVIVRAVRSYASDPAHTVVAINQDEERDWPVAETLMNGFPGVRVVQVPSAAKGALISALLASESISPERPLVIAAGDSEVVGGIAQHIATLESTGAAAGTVVFRATEPRWSYLAVDPEGAVTQIAEKAVIGPLATTGVFYFRRADFFLDAAEWCLVNSAHHDGRYYVSTALNQLLVKGLRVGYVEIDRQDYVPSALPIDFVEESVEQSISH